MAWAAQQKTGNTTRKFILMMLADRANDSGECWPSIATIMSDCEISSKTTVINHTNRLEKDNFIQINKRSVDGVSLPNKYKLNIGGVVQIMNGGGSKIGGRGGSNNEPKPIIKPIIEPLRKRETQFWEEINSFKDKYSQHHLKSFFDYWTEKDSGDNLRFETQDAWELSKRLSRWKPRNEKKSEKANTYRERGFTSDNNGRDPWDN